MVQQQVVRALTRPEAYPAEDRPAHVETVETHVSYLFFTGRHAYKVKKAVDFGFLDFTTLEKRRYFCEREVALNRRLSPRVYLRVAKVREREGAYTIDGPGDVVEYAVVMRQLRHSDAMDEVLARGELSEETVRRIARQIAAFHHKAERSPEITAQGGLRTVRENVQENFRQTEAYIRRTIAPDAYDRIRAYSEAFMDIKEDLFQRRASSGAIRDCHGDLHMDHVFLDGDVEIIDCIEFNDRFRYSDVASDVAFLAMDLDYASRPDLAETLQRAYVAASGDKGLLELLNFYKCYRAYVRAKVDSLRIDQVADNPTELRRVQERVEKHVALADAYATPKRPVLAITVGLMGTGKSRMAAMLAQSLNAEVISSDVLRKEIAGLPVGERRHHGWQEGFYSPEALEQTYQELHGQAAEKLALGRTVILDASYRRQEWRRKAMKVAQAADVPLVALECVCPAEVVRQRLDNRLTQLDTPSDGRWELYLEQASAFEAVQELAGFDHVVVDTSLPEEEARWQALYGVYRKLMSIEGWI